MSHSSNLIPFLFGAWVLLVSGGTATAANPVGDGEFDFAIDRQGAGSALVELGERAGVQIAVASGISKKVEVGPLNGRYTLVGALARMLENTGLAYHFVADDAVFVSIDEAAPSAENSGGGDGTRPTRAPDGEQTDDGEGESSADVDTEVVVVVGTRLTTGDPSARVLVIDQAEIQARGVTTVEEIIRSIPHNFSTINSFNNLISNPGEALDADLGSMGLGISTANLRGFGSANTLVLVNGKRIAGAAGHEDLFANIRHIPASAIERVEVHLDGGSAVFGSEAVAGVINVVLRKDTTDMKITGRTEVSSTGGDRRLVNAHGGYGWGTGRVILTASLTQSDPVRNDKAGWTTRDHSASYGGDPRYNFISPTFCPTRSGRVGTAPWPPLNLILPEGDDGRDAQPPDFGRVTIDDCLDRVPIDAGGTTEDTSITLYAHQDIGSKLSLSAGLLGTRAKTESRVSTFGYSSIPVPASNAFNNFGRTVFVHYTADTEAELGLIQDDTQTDVTEQTRYTVGLQYEFTDKIRLSVDYSKGESHGWGDQLMFAATNRDIVSPAVAARLSELLSSPDPNVALNLFGDGTAQNPTIAEYFKPRARENDRSHVESWEAYVAFEMIDLPAGTMEVVLGGERREEWIENLQSMSLARVRGVPRPTRDFSSMFGELKIPIIKSDRAGLRSLTLSGQVHYDEYSSYGAVGRNEDGSPSNQQVMFDNVAARLGIAWQPTEHVTVRLSLAEAFKPPVFSQLFSTQSLSRPSNFVFDPLLQTFVSAISSFAPNPELKPQNSLNTSFAIQWRPANGLEVDLGYSEIDYEDRITRSQELRRLLSGEEYGNLSQFFRRDESGTLIEAIQTSINISRRVNKTLDMDVQYSFTTRWGTFRPEFTYQRVLSMFDQAIPGAEKFDFVGEAIGIDRAKARARLHWSNEPYRADLYVHFTPGHINNYFENTSRAIPNKDVDARWTVDLTGTYEMTNGLTLRAGGRNIFDTDFPLSLNQSGRPWDTRRVDLRKRVLFLEVSYVTQ